MSETTTNDADAVEALERRLEERREQRKREERAQERIDLTARLDLEDEHGTVGVVRVPFVKGSPTQVYVRPPTPAEYKRYKQTVQNAAASKRTRDVGNAQDQIAEACWVYPGTPEERASMAARVSGILTSIGVVAIRLAEGAAEEEGKA
jgi:hypothetical protein